MATEMRLSRRTSKKKKQMFMIALLILIQIVKIILKLSIFGQKV